MITQPELKDLLSYCSSTGLFTWVKSRGSRIKGDIAGCLFKTSNGKTYIRIKVKGRKYMAHRLAFLFVTGSWPEDEMDHVNGDGTDNGWLNIRSVTHSENMLNKRVPHASVSGISGVTWNKRVSKWQVAIRKDGRQHYLGVFADVELAALIRAEAEEVLGFHPNHGTVRPL